MADKSFKVVGRRDVPGSLSYPIATGKAKYPRDLVYPDMLFAKILRSPYARARIKSMDVSQAKALAGVKAVITWEDPELKAQPFAYKLTKTPALSDVAEREGDEVGVMVAAESEEIAEEALKLVKIEWQVLPHILKPQDAIKFGAPALHPTAKPDNVESQDNWEDGNVEEGFKQSAHIIEFDYYGPHSTTFNSQPITVVSRWVQDPAGTEGPTLYTTPMYRDKGLAVAREAMGVEWGKVLPITMYVASGLCDGDPRRASRLVPLLAKRTGRPVRLAYTRREAFDVGGPAVYTHMKVGFNNDGMIVAAHGKTLSSVGVEADYEKCTSDITCFRMTKAQNIKNETTYVWTNTDRNAFLRAGSFPTASDTLAMAIYQIADQLGMDPSEVLMKNVHTPEPSVKECMDKGKAAIDWQWHKAGAKQLPNGRMHGIGFRLRDSHSWGGNNAIALKLKTDGKVYIPFGSAYFGTFGQDACAMIVAEELGARLEDVQVQMQPGAPYSFIVSASDMPSTGYAARMAAIDLKAKILATAAPMLKVTPAELDTKDSTVFVKADPTKTVPFGALVSDDVGTLGSLNSMWQGTPPTTYDWTAKKYGPVNAIFGQVEVDTETGEVFVNKMVCAYDGGTVIRPSSFEGQMEGGMIWTISKAKAEEYVFDPATGVLLNGSALEYKPSTILDSVNVEPIIVETGTGGGVYGSTGVGENTWDQSVIACAVFNAIGEWIEYPITPDKVLAALGKI